MTRIDDGILLAAAAGALDVVRSSGSRAAAVSLQPDSARAEAAASMRCPSTQSPPFWNITVALGAVRWRRAAAASPAQRRIEGDCCGRGALAPGRSGEVSLAALAAAGANGCARQKRHRRLEGGSSVQIQRGGQEVRRGMACLG